MEFFLQPLRELSPRALRCSLFLVLVCGSVLGYFVLRTFAGPLHRQYQLDFGTAQWIEPADFAPVAYFRRNIFLNAAPEQAWLEVAATDSFDVIINGQAVGIESNPKTRIAQIYDIKKFLRPGTNVIAISVRRVSYPGSAQLLVCASFKEPASKPNFVVSDEHWRVTQRLPLCRVLRNGSLPWCSGRSGRTRAAPRSLNVRSRSPGWIRIRFCFDPHSPANGSRAKAHHGRQSFPRL